MKNSLRTRTENQSTGQQRDSPATWTLIEANSELLASCRPNPDSEVQKSFPVKSKRALYLPQTGRSNRRLYSRTTNKRNASGVAEVCVGITNVLGAIPLVGLGRQPQSLIWYLFTEDNHKYFIRC